jgi:uncharacterized protein with PQ loop repeat
MNYPDILMSVAGTIFCCSLLPQIVRVSRLRDASQLSWWFLLPTLIGLTLFTVGTAMVRCYGAAVVDGLCVFGYAMLCVQKLCFKREN